MLSFDYTLSILGRRGGFREIMSNGDTLCCSNKVKLVIIITVHKHPPTHISCLYHTVRINVVFGIDICLGIIQSY